MGETREGAETSAQVHEIHDFAAGSQRRIEEAYARIQKRVREDPGTAGDQGEENWKKLLEEWLPPYFQIVTKGRILFPSGVASPQIDVLVLSPSYPKGLLSEKLYIAGGVAAAFECKVTLRNEHIRLAIQTGTTIKRAISQREGSPYKELNSPIVFGLLAHSHCWKEEKSTPVENVDSTLLKGLVEDVAHPREMLDILCVADVGTWSSAKINCLPASGFQNPEMARQYAGRTSAGYVCHAQNSEKQKPYFSPVGCLIVSLFHKLAWTFQNMRALDIYFRQVDMLGNGIGRMRHWPPTVYTTATCEKIMAGHLKNPGEHFDEWAVAQF